MKVTEVQKTRSLGCAKKKGQLFRLEGAICMSLGWPTNDNDVHFVVLEGDVTEEEYKALPGNKQYGHHVTGTKSSRHNGQSGVELLEGELRVWLQK
jgi:hypothetical protein